MIGNSTRLMFVVPLFLLFSLGVIGTASSRQGGNGPVVPLPGLVSSSQSAIKPLDPIQSAPEFSLTTVLGGELSSKELKGKVVVVEFWATWAVPSIADIPEYNQLQKKLKSQGLEFIGVVYDSGTTAQAVEPFLKQFQIEYPVAMGTTEVDQAFGGHLGYPTTFLIGRDWKVYRKISGRVPDKLATLERDILALLERPTN